MSDDSPRFHRQLAGLATDWVRAKRRSLERGRPNTKTDSGGTVSQYSFDGQELNRNELRKVRDIRKSGGIVASLFNKKALMRFGGGAELQSDNDDLEEWLAETYQRLDLIVLDLGLDATWFPYGLGEPAVETRSGEFSHVEFVEPWTTLPKTSEYGEILAWEQETQDGSTQVFDPEEIGSIVVNKAAARDKVGVSEVLRNEEEITQYKENQRAVDKAVEIAGFPHHVWTVGAEGRSPVDDNDLRRVRNLIDNMDGDTQFVVGPDVEHDKITPTDFDFQSITKRDLRILTTAIGLPFEVAGYGREGMGSGSETELIGKMHSLENQVARRRFETQFVEEFVRPVVEKYSPYDPEEHINLEISPFHDESEDVAELISKIGDYMSNEEIRERLDLPPLEDDEIADAYRTPKAIEEAEEAPEDAGGGGFGDAGFFSSSNMRRVMQEVPDNAVSITDPSEAPEDANVIEGPGGGLYYVPGGGGGAGGDDGGGGANVRSEEPPDSVDLSKEEDSQTLEDAGIVDGSNHEDMRISQLEDGSEVFVRENTSDLDADSIAAGYSVYKQAGIEIPDHHIDEDGTLAKEGVSGSTLRSQNFDPDNVDEDSLIDAYAGVMLAGDTDMHGANMMVRDDGTVVPVDIAGSGGVLSPEDHQNKIESQLDTLGADVEFEEIVNRAEELAGDIDPAQIPEGEDWDMMKDNITERVEEMA